MRCVGVRGAGRDRTWVSTDTSPSCWQTSPRCQSLQRAERPDQTDSVRLRQTERPTTTTPDWLTYWPTSWLWVTHWPTYRLSVQQTERHDQTDSVRLRQTVRPTTTTPDWHTDPLTYFMTEWPTDPVLVYDICTVCGWLQQVWFSYALLCYWLLTQWPSFHCDPVWYFD